MFALAPLRRRQCRLTAQYAPGSRRSLLTNAMFCGFPLGAAGGGLLAAWLIPHYGWRGVLILGGAVPLLLAMPLLWRLPESLRYLVASGRPVDRIRQILGRMTTVSMSRATDFAEPDANAESGKRAIGLVRAAICSAR
jgi:AAHS family 4-hydroxybenzoate transporter-like MFS transporter